MTYEQIHQQFFPLLSGESTLTISVADAIDMVRRGIELNSTRIDGNSFLDADIAEYPYINTRMKNVLLTNNFTTFREVKDAGHNLYRCKYISKKTVTELKELFEYHGLKLNA